MIFDTDLIIWAYKGNHRASQLLFSVNHRFLSLQSNLELLQCAQNQIQQDASKNFIKDMEFTVLPLSENIGHRALIYLEEYGLSGGLRAGDAIIAATAVENNLPLATGNYKHFKHIRDLILKKFKPE